jgi:hypothetical protein
MIESKNSIFIITLINQHLTCNLQDKPTLPCLPDFQSLAQHTLHVWEIKVSLLTTNFQSAQYLVSHHS